MSADIGGAGGAGVANAVTITTILTNNGKISGGAGSRGVGGAGVVNAQGGTIGSLTNQAAGAISGGAGGNGAFFGGMGGAGVSNAGTITTLTNSGTIEGGKGGTGSFANGGAAGDAIYSAGANASIGSITNSGKIIGNVEIDNQASVTVYGGTGKRFGSWTGGVITIGNGNLTFAGGNTALGDNIIVNGGAGTVYNNDPLMVTTPIAITGNFDQSGTGALDFLLSSATDPTQYKFSVTGSTSLDGDLGIDLGKGFSLMAGDSFDLIASQGALSGDFTSLFVDGGACSAHGTDVWRCSRDYLDLSLVAGSVDLSVAAASSVPEPATWVMLGVGFLGLGGLALRRRTPALAA